MLRTIRIVAVALAVVLAGAGGYAWWQLQQGVQSTGSRTSGLVTNVSIGGPFSLVDHNGQTVTEADFRGQMMLIYFGYTFCPDVCPTELGDISLALDELGDDLEALTPVLITIDPERDTPEVLSEYVPLFHEKLVGLTGTQDEVDRVAKAYRVFYRKVEDPQYTYYLMDHTSFIYLMGPEGEFLSMFAYGTPPEQIAETIRAHL